MTRLDRVLKLFEDYDNLAACHFESKEYLVGHEILCASEKKKKNSPKNLSSTDVGGRINYV